jgi:tRNA(Arg) A34 adenosine deaminase TadA
MSHLICRRAAVAASVGAVVGLAASKKHAHAQTPKSSVSPTDMARHEKFMRLAIAQANKNPGRPFGSVLVDERSGNVVGEGVVDLKANPMFHSEVVAMNDFVAKYGNHGWENLTMYGTGEACPMCMCAMVWAGIPRMVYGSETPYVRKYIKDINIRAQDVVAASHPLYTNKLLLGGVLSDQTDKLFTQLPPVDQKK